MGFEVVGCPKNSLVLTSNAAQMGPWIMYSNDVSELIQQLWGNNNDNDNMNTNHLTADIFRSDNLIFRF